MGYAIVPLEPSQRMLNAMSLAYWQKQSDIMSVSPTEEYEAGGGSWGYAYRAMVDYKELEDRGV
jgi:hypothetical protein